MTSTVGWSDDELAWALRWFGAELDAYGYGDAARAALNARAVRDAPEALPLTAGPWLVRDGGEIGACDDGADGTPGVPPWPAVFEFAWYPVDAQSIAIA